MHPVPFGDLSAHRVEGMQGGLGVLKDHGHLPATPPTGLLVVQVDDVA